MVLNPGFNYDPIWAMPVEGRIIQRAIKMAEFDAVMFASCRRQRRNR